MSIKYSYRNLLALTLLLSIDSAEALLSYVINRLPPLIIIRKTYFRAVTYHQFPTILQYTWKLDLSSRFGVLGIFPHFHAPDNRQGRKSSQQYWEKGAEGSSMEWPFKGEGQLSVQ